MQLLRAPYTITILYDGPQDIGLTQPLVKHSCSGDLAQLSGKQPTDHTIVIVYGILKGAAK